MTPNLLIARQLSRQHATVSPKCPEAPSFDSCENHEYSGATPLCTPHSAASSAYSVPASPTVPCQLTDGELQRDEIKLRNLRDVRETEGSSSETEESSARSAAMTRRFRAPSSPMVTPRSPGGHLHHAQDVRSSTSSCDSAVAEYKASARHSWVDPSENGTSLSWDRSEHGSKSQSWTSRLPFFHSASTSDGESQRTNRASDLGDSDEDLRVRLRRWVPCLPRIGGRDAVGSVEGSQEPNFRRLSSIVFEDKTNKAN